jgi:hypothetical protein
MNTQITYWQHIILTNKNVEPKTAEELANYKLAEYILFGKIK